MKQKALSVSGSIVFWLIWPFLAIYFRFTRRTRVLLIAENAVLLLKTWPSAKDYWTLPGGGIQSGERPVESAQRELREETGISVDVKRFTLLTEARFHGFGYSFPCTYFLVESDKKSKISPHFPEIIATEWVPLERLHEYRVGEEVRVALSAWRALVQ